MTQTEPLERPGKYIFIIFPLACILLGGLSGYVSGSGDSDWYRALQKSPLNPPGWVFGVVWPILYLLMGVAAAIVWRKVELPRRRVAMTLFAVQLVVNLTWSPVFFALHMIGLAVLHIGVLWVLVVLTINTFWHFSRVAACLMVPYLMWISFAAWLSYSVWQLNS